MPSDFMLKTMNVAHRALLKVTFGKVGWNVGPMPVVELTTTGRKSGQERTVMLTSPVQLGESIVLVASRGGDDHHPAWYHNLVANPNVTAKLRGRTHAMTARVMSSEERTELWPKVTGAYKGYAGYQEKTDREIPLVILDPRVD